MKITFEYDTSMHEYFRLTVDDVEVAKHLWPTDALDYLVAVVNAQYKYLQMRGRLGDLLSKAVT